MSKNKKRKCIVCGNEYDYCHSCPKDADKPVWYYIFCSEECHKLGDILTKQTNGEIDLLTAKKEIISSNLQNIKTFDSDVQNHIDKIMAVKEPRKTVATKKTVEAVEPVTVEETVKATTVKKNIKK